MAVTNKKYYISFEGYKGVLEISQEDFNNVLQASVIYQSEIDSKMVKVRSVLNDRIYIIPYQKINFLTESDYNVGDNKTI